MSDDTNDGDFWKYEVDTVQRHGTTAATRARRHGEVSVPKASDDYETGQADTEEKEQGSDEFGIPVQFKSD